MPFLENFRTNNLAYSYFTLSGYPGQRIYKDYDRYATKAFHDTFRDISNLENFRIHPSQAGFQSHSSIAFWFLTLESCVSTFLRICAFKLEHDFDNYRKLSLTQQLLLLIQLLNLDKKSFNESDIVGKVHEFSQFRNELFKERKTGEELIFRKTLFSPLPFLCNQVDNFQAMLIVLEITLRFRNIFPGISTTPLITLSNGQASVQEELDSCYYNILMPCFSHALRKHHLNTALLTDLEIEEGQVSSSFVHGEVCLQKTREHHVKQDEQYNPDTTTNCLSTLNEFIGLHEHRQLMV